MIGPLRCKRNLAVQIRFRIFLFFPPSRKLSVPRQLRNCLSIGERVRHHLSVLCGLGNAHKEFPQRLNTVFHELHGYRIIVITNLSSEYVDVSLIVFVLTALVVDTANWVVVVVAIQTTLTTRQISG